MDNRALTSDPVDPADPIKGMIYAFEKVTPEDIEATQLHCTNLCNRAGHGQLEEVTQEFSPRENIQAFHEELQKLRKATDLLESDKRRFIFEYYASWSQEDLNDITNSLHQLMVLHDQFAHSNIPVDVGDNLDSDFRWLWMQISDYKPNLVPQEQQTKSEGFFARMEKKFFDFVSDHFLLTLFLAFAIPALIATILVFSGGAAAIPMGIGAFIMESGAAWACVKVAVALIFTEVAAMFVNLIKNLWGAATAENNVVITPSRLSQVDWLNDKTFMGTRPRRMSVAKIQQSLPPLPPALATEEKQDDLRDDLDTAHPDHQPAPLPQPQPQPSAPNQPNNVYTNAYIHFPSSTGMIRKG